VLDDTFDVTCDVVTPDAIPTFDIPTKITKANANIMDVVQSLTLERENMDSRVTNK
jgi:hypothetical protein